MQKNKNSTTVNTCKRTWLQGRLLIISITFSRNLKGNCYDENCETNKGTLTSSTFTLKKDSYVSFRFGGAGGAENHDVYILLCRTDGSVIAKFYNDAPDKLNVLMNAYYPSMHEIMCSGYAK